MTNWSIDLTVVNSLKSKLTNKKVKGVFWPVVESLWGVSLKILSYDILKIKLDLTRVKRS